MAQESASGSGGLIRVGDLTIDPGRRLVTRRGDVLHMTGTEWRLLECLAMNAGRVTLSADLLVAVWGPEHGRDVQYLRVWISRLRGKLEPRVGEQTVIKTVQGIGYMLEGASAAGPGASP